MAPETTPRGALLEFALAAEFGGRYAGTPTKGNSTRRKLSLPRCCRGSRPAAATPRPAGLIERRQHGFSACIRRLALRKVAHSQARDTQAASGRPARPAQPLSG
jgi:hypothetical protein